MKFLPQGQADICQYYHIAPAIVDKIHAQPDANKILDRIYNELILPCVELIRIGDNETAYTKYHDYVKLLQEQYLIEMSTHV